MLTWGCGGWGRAKFLLKRNRNDIRKVKTRNLSYHLKGQGTLIEWFGIQSSEANNVTNMAADVRALLWVEQILQNSKKAQWNLPKPMN